MNDLSNYAGLRPGVSTLPKRELVIRTLCAVPSTSGICSDSLSSTRYSICHQLKGALVLQLEIGKKNTSTAPLHGRIFIRICLQHSQGDLFCSTASERTMTLTDSCCFHHLKWLPTQHLYIWCMFLLNPGVYNHVFPAVCKLRPYGTHIEACAFL